MKILLCLLALFPLTAWPQAANRYGVGGGIGLGYGTDTALPATQTGTQTLTGTLAPSAAGPVIDSVYGAGLSIPPVTRITSGGLISIFGSNFTPAGVTHGLQESDLIDGDKLPTNMAQTCVQIGGTPAPLYFVSSTEINAQTPGVPSSGSVPVSVVAGCGTATALESQPVTVPVAASAPEFLYFVQNPNGQQPVAAVDAFSGAFVGNPGLIPGATLAVANLNQTLSLFGVGFGATLTPVAPGILAPDADATAGKAIVMIGEIPATVLYAGRAPGFAGLYQVNVVVPEGIATGNSPIMIQVNGGTSPPGAYLATVGMDYLGSDSLGGITVAPASVELRVDQTVQLETTVTNAVGFVLSALPTPPVWMSSNNQVASVSASGIVTGVGAGNATITAFYSSFSGTSTITVVRPRKTPGK